MIKKCSYITFLLQGARGLFGRAPTGRAFGTNTALLARICNPCTKVAQITNPRQQCGVNVPLSLTHRYFEWLCVVETVFVY